ncbi:hypothetical protein QJS10_CPB14g00176 [Acorus calamus]|uniref:Single-stranded DNA-binding protein, mitochondrial n=1 Tax=Acorus calamus TaxID=4465 RepID=A0AAV9DA07_ACOCL|nr:hypothetical protein QJS10_CPB14g00176 [Acorus calamus]
MASSSIASLSQRLSRSLRTHNSLVQRCLCTYPPPAGASDAEADSDDPTHDSDRAPPTPPPFFDRPLEQGLDLGVYRAIMVGKVGQAPVQKRLKSGRLVTLFVLGTGGIRNNRRPFNEEDPKEYANRCAVQWHRVSVYPEKLGMLAMNNVRAGSILYVEGNLETKVFNDQATGIVRRIREIALRRDGRLVFLSKESDAEQLPPSDLRSVGYF